jgi:hypothetical protein
MRLRSNVLSSIRQVRAQFPSFLRWWGTELLALIPRRLKQLSQPFLFLDNVAIADRPDNRSPNAAAEDAVLDVRFDVFGYMRRAL